MKEVTKSGRTVEEALRAAISELQTTKDHVKYEVIEESKKGFLGIGFKPAVVQVRIKKDPLETARTFLRNVTAKMGVPIEIEESRDERNFIFTLSAEKIAVLIGKRGNTLNALQYLTNVAANRHADEHIHVLLDAENYRERREETLQQLAKRMADKARHTGRIVQLDPMPSMERRVIHIALKGEEGIVTHSEGADPNRKIIITPSKGE